MEGAGVHLRRAFGFGNTTDFDPFLLLDDFRNDVPDDYLAGFPWHPHRGIETITYVLAGTVNTATAWAINGAIGSGDVQWMTAGSGIIHQEMPKGDDSGRMHGFQFWANLPSSLKMTPPRYQEIKSGEIPEVTDDDGTHVRWSAASFGARRGPVEGIAADLIYIDVSVPPGGARRYRWKPRVMPSPMSSPDPASSAMHRAACGSDRKREVVGHRATGRSRQPLADSV